MTATTARAPLAPGDLRGDVRDDGFTRVVEAHGDTAVRLAWMLCGDRTAAEDVAAEAIARVYERWRAGAVHDVGPYLRRAVINGSKKHHRRRAVERRHAARATPLPPSPSPADAIADADAVVRALARLPGRQRTAVVLRYYCDLSELSTANVMGCSTGAVKKHVSRGLERLRALIDMEAPR